MFAVARMNIVEIYSSLTFHLVSLFKTHLDTVRSMCWTENDGRIVSAGRDGAIYEWEASGNINLRFVMHFYNILNSSP